MNHKELLLWQGPCEDGALWYNGRDSHKAWLACQRGDWLLWVAGRLDVDRNLMVAAACDCAELALPLTRRAALEAEKAIATTRRWLEGDATQEEVLAAADAAVVVAAGDHTWSDAVYAAARAAEAIARAGSASSAAAFTALAVYSIPDGRACYVVMHEQCAQLVRKRIPWRLIEAAIAVKDKEAETTQ